MTREEALTEIKERVFVTEYVNSSYVDCISIEALRIAIKALEEQQWIPCSERLPEDRSKTWVTTEWGDDNRTAEYAFYWDNELKWGAITENVIAWMPLPEPWRGDAE